MKAYLPKYTLIEYYGENRITDYEYWTSGETIEEIRVNLTKKVAIGEPYTIGIKDWKHIYIYKEDIIIVE